MESLFDVKETVLHLLVDGWLRRLIPHSHLSMRGQVSTQLPWLCSETEMGQTACLAS